MKNQRNRHELKKAREVKYTLLAMSIVAVLLIAMCLPAGKKPSGSTTRMSIEELDEKCVRLGFQTNWPTWMKERHVTIAQQGCLPRIDDSLTPVHIMRRSTETNVWVLAGSGGLLHHFPNFLITARHVMETDVPLQFGYRIIGQRELDGSEPIVPIQEINEAGNMGDDSVLCRLDTNMTSFPMIVLSESPNTFKEFIPDAKYISEYYPAHVRLSTRPNEVIQCVFSVKVKENCSYIFTTTAFAPGESGSIGIVEEETNKQARVIAILNQRLPKELVSMFPDQWKRQLDWSPDRWYGVVEMIGIK